MLIIKTNLMTNKTLLICLLSILLLLTTINVQAQDKYTNKGDKAFEGKQFFEALKNYEMALGAKADDPYLNMRVAQCYLILGPKSKALTLANNAVKLSEKPTPEMYFTLAQALHISHKFDEAIANYQKADPSNSNKKAISKYINECGYGKQYLGQPKDFKITNAGPIVNTQHQEYLPQITADLSKLFFTSRRPGSTGGKVAEDGLHYEDIYISNNQGGAWSPPVNPGGPLNTEGHDALPFNSAMFETCASLSPDGRTLFFVRAMDFSSQRDLYMCRKTTGDNWSKAVKLPFNTEYDEDSPYMHPDGKTLYFSSKGHTTMGGYDVFKVTMLGGGGWSKPENLGYPMNTAGNDLYFVLGAEGKVGYYASDKDGGLGKQDLYSVRMPISAKEPQLTLMKGKIKDATGNSVEAKITVNDNQTGEVLGEYKSNAETGEYLIALPSDHNYGVTIEKPGKLFYSENVYLSSNAGFKQEKKDVVLADSKAGSKIVLKNVFFDTGKDQLRLESKTELARVTKLLQDNPSIKIEISGHTDNVGSEEINQQLSEKRAKSVVAFLIQNGIPAARLKAVGYGSKSPVADNTTEAGKQLNRRTELKIL
ncbi:MAG: ompA [Cytophagaceae bacterium]|nr:ompA [Cytophagaceae bacterium]